MIQEIITYTIVAGAILYTLYGFIQVLFPSKVKSNGHSCCGSCSGCALKNDVGLKTVSVKRFN